MKLLITLIITACSLIGANAQSMMLLKDALSLSPEQEVKTKQIQKESSIEMRGIYKLRATNPTKYLKERERIAAETDAKYKLILTEDQFSVYSEMRKDQETRFKNVLKPTAIKKKTVIQ